MNHLKAIGFDLFNTLITAEPHTLREAVSRLTSSLRKSGFPLEDEPFKRSHQESALRLIGEAHGVGRETHNRFWISAALQDQGFNVLPDDPRIAIAVDAYFSAFLQYCHLVPKTIDMLKALKGRYVLGLLSNFTHAPAARQIIDGLELTPFFDVVLISGELGYCKPHPLVFRQLVNQLGVEKNRTLYVGDDLEMDIVGAHQAGLQPVWMTYVLDKNIPFAPGLPSPSTEGLNWEIPRISSWKELLDLVNKD